MLLCIYGVITNTKKYLQSDWLRGVDKNIEMYSLETNQNQNLSLIINQKLSVYIFN